MSKPVLFLLEDNRSLVDRLVRMAKRLGWEVITARSLQAAREACQKTPDLKVETALIDLMIPATNAELARADELLGLRNAKSAAATDRAATANDREVAIGEIDRIDRQIEELILDDGGIRFIDSDEGRRL